MKIWIIGRGYPTENNGMWGLFEFEQAKLLARYGHDVCYLSLTLSVFKHGSSRGYSKFDVENVHVFAKSSFYFPGKTDLHWWGYEDYCWKSIMDDARETYGAPDLIHIHYPAMIGNSNAIERYHKRGVKLVATEHWSRVLVERLKKWDISRLKYFARNADCFTAVSDSLLAAVARYSPIANNKGTIPNMVSPVFTKKNAPHNGFSYIAIGRLVDLKQFDIVIEQFKKIKAEDSDTSLVVVGSGAKRAKLQSLAGADPNILFTGSQAPDKVAELLARSDALVSYSQYETFGVPVIEAWATGKPVIVSATSGVSSYVTSELGVVVDANRPEELYGAMLHMKDQVQYYDSAVISQKCKTEFGSEAVYDLLMRLYT